MKTILLTITFFCCLFISNAATFNLDATTNNTIITTSGDTLYDSGGSGNVYGNNNDFSITIAPTRATKIAINVNIIDFNTGDSLCIYEGWDATGTLLRKFKQTNTTSNTTYSLKSNSNAIFIVFKSDGSSQGNGFAISWVGTFTIDSDITQISCNGLTDGAIDVTPLGGTAPFTYSWSNDSATTKSITSLKAGKYPVKITDKNGIIVQDTFNIIEPTALAFTYDSVNPGCAASSDGEIRISAEGGSGLYNYSKDGTNWTNSYQFTNLDKGDYIIYVRDSLSQTCTTNKTVKLDYRNPAINFTYSSVKASCSAVNNGEIYVSATGGSGSYIYKKGTTNNNSPHFTNLDGATVYTIKVEDANSTACSHTETITVGDNSDIAFTYDSTKATCSTVTDGKLIVSATGGTGNYIYFKDASSNATNVFSGLNGATPYTIKVEDAANSGCSATKSITVGNNVNIAFTYDSTKATCSAATDGKLIVSATGGTGNYKYFKGASSNATNIFSGLNGATAYTIKVEDAANSGCSATKSITVGNNLNIAFTYDSTKATCGSVQDGKLIISATGGTGNYQYFKDASSNATNVFSGLDGATEYTIKVEDAANPSCFASKPITVGNNVNIDFSYNSTKATCSAATDGKLIVSATGGTGNYQYFEGINSNLTNVFSGLNGATPYTIKVEDAANSGCSATKSITVGNNLNIAFTYDSTKATCSSVTDGKLIVSATGGTGNYKYFKGASSNATNIFENLDGNYDYIIKVVDAANSGCSHIDTIKVGDYNNISFTYDSTKATCGSVQDGKLIISATGGTGNYQYFKDASSNATNVFSGLDGATEYTIKVEDAANPSCFASKPITVGNNVNIDFSYNSTKATCSAATDGKLIVSATGGTGNYQYFEGINSNLTNVFSGLNGATEYTIKVEDAANSSCFASKNITVGITSPIQISTTKKNPLCNNSTDGEIFVSVSGGSGNYQYKIDTTGANWGSSNKFTGLIAGNYTVSIRDANVNACEVTSTPINLENPSKLNLVNNITNNLCNGDNTGAIDLTVSGGTAPYQYNWSNSKTTEDLTGIAAGTYTVVVNDAHACKDSIENISVTQPTKVVASITKDSDVTIANGNNGKATATATEGTVAGDYSYSWNTLPTQNSATATGLSKGTYTVTVTDDNGCTDTETVTITEPTILIGGEIRIDGAKYDSICKGSNPKKFTEFTNATGGISPYNYYWQYSTDLDSWANYTAPTTANEFDSDVNLTENTFIRRRVADNNGAEAYSNILKIFMVDTVNVSFQNLNDTYCESDSIVEFSATPKPANSNLGKFTIASGMNLTDFSSGTAELLISNLGGTTQSLTYKYTDIYGCESSISKNITIYDTLFVSMTIQPTYGLADSPDSIEVTPAVNHASGSGFLTGMGINPYTMDFDPAIAGTENSPHKITYTFTTNDGCITSISKMVNVVSSGGTIKALDATNSPTIDITKMCVDAEKVIIQAIPDSSVNTIIGYTVVSPTGASACLSYISGMTAELDVKALPSGTDSVTILFEYLGGTPVVLYNVEKTISIIDVGTINFSIPDTTFCLTDASVNLLVDANTPVGSFSGSGSFITAGRFSPSAAGVGANHYIYYTTALDEGCFKKDSINMIVYEMPSITSIDYKKIFNINEPKFELTATTNHSGSGSFNGTGVDQSGSSYFFVPSDAGVGNHDLQYIFTDNNGCSVNFNGKIKVESNDQKINVKDADKILCYYQSKDTLWAKPDTFNVTGRFYGPGIIDLGNDTALFDPSVVGKGSHTVYYSYKVDLGIEAYDTALFTISQKITVDSIENLNFKGLGTDYCVDAAQVTITGDPQVSFPLGKFEGNGITMGLNTATFNPSIADTSTHEISYIYINDNGCTDTITKTVNVHPLPVITDIYTKHIYNISEINDTLRANPSGGIFTGSGILSDSIFSPTAVGVGEYDITYRYTENVHSCSNNSTFKIYVKSSNNATMSINNNKVYCYTQDNINERIDTIVASSGVNGITGYLYGKGITNISPDTAIFDITAAGNGSHTIYYTYTLSGGAESYDTAQFIISRNVFVDSIAPVNFSGLDTIYCINNSAVTLIGSPRASFPLGNFKGQNVTNNPATADAYFYPSTVGIFDINYTYTTSKGCSDSISKSVKVYDLPVVQSIDSRNFYNKNESSDTLHGIPSGGKFLGSGILSDSIFTPYLVSSGTHTIKYEIEDEHGCKNSKSYQITVETTKGSIIIPDADQVYCYNQGIDTLIGIPDTMKVEGVFTGKGIIDLDNNRAIFDPIAAGAGNHTIVYTYYDPSNQAKFEVSSYIIVDSIGKLKFDLADTSYCENAVQFKVPVINGRTDGTHTFTGIPGEGALTSQLTSAFVAPQKTVPGTYNLTYTYSTSYKCTDSIVQGITITELPKIAFDIDTLMNVSDVKQELLGTPANGIFSGTGIVPDYNTKQYFFYPDISKVGTFDITYSYTDIDGCSNSLSKKIIVQQSAASIEGYDKYYCFYEEPDTIWAYSTNGMKGGKLSGAGIVEFNPPKEDSVLFYPNMAGDGQHVILYEYYGTDGTTKFDASIQITVDPQRELSISGLNDTAYCMDADKEILTGLPQGGSFSGDGITGKEFIPAKGKIGNNIITYSHSIYYTAVSGLTIDTLKICTLSVSDTVRVDTLPNVYFTGLDADKAYCSNEPTVNLFGNQLTGTFSVNVFTDNDTARITPSSLNEGANVIKYTYTDANGCSNTFADTVTIFKIPSLRILDLKADYCRRYGNDTISGEVIGAPQLSVGGFYGGGIIDSDTLDGIAVFNPDYVTQTGSYTITYKYYDQNGCISSVSKNVVVNKLPPVSLDGYNPTYCQYDDGDKLIGGPLGGTYTIDDISSSVQNTFSPDQPGKHYISYRFKDENGCEDIVKDSIVVYQAPSVHFSITDECIEDSIQFLDKTKAISGDPIVNWSWDFGDLNNLNNNNKSTKQNPKHLYLTDGSKKISLNVTTSTGCEYSTDSTITLGRGPLADFSWFNECMGDSVRFTNNSSGSGIVNYKWTFGDGNEASIPNPAHKYNDTEEYNVTLKVSTENDCNDNITKTITIRPVISSFPYSEDFETGKASWVAGTNDSINSWEFGTPAGRLLNGASSGKNAWCTNLDSSFLPNEYSWVDGPCFDFSQLQKPMIKLKYQSHTDAGFDGAVLQASTDNGITWERIGELEDGINWYNKGEIIGIPTEVDIRQYGWSGISTDEWIEARHDLDNYINGKNLRFRVVFASDASSNKEGFTFDDIWIGERSRNVLTEQFVNISSNSANSISEYNQFIDDNKLDIVDIHYHTNFGGNDALFTHNQAVASARSFYYGVSSTPFSIFDGNQYTGASSDLLSDISVLKLRALTDPKFEIKLTTDITGESINIKTQVKALSEISESDITVYIAVVEDSITGINTSSNQLQYRNVVKSILPDASGTNYKQSWYNNDRQLVEASWNMKNVFDKNKLSVVVFVQDENTKEVYQAVSSIGTSTNPVSINKTTQSDITLYPNPANDFVIINTGSSSQLMNIMIFNEMGQQVDEHYTTNSSSTILNTTNYQAGIYYVHIQLDNNEWSINKLVVVK